jgi:glycosyltransferase involved in cell wall biosynthesis
MPAVSILIPVYNSPHFVDALDSALDQSFADIEIIVSDDSTNDDAHNVVLTKSDSRIRYVRNTPSLGFHANFAQCCLMARGTYIKFLNHDDILRGDCVAQMVDAFTQLGDTVSLVFARRARIDIFGNVMPDDIQTQPIAQRNGAFRAKMLANICLMKSANFIGEPSAVMFRRSAVLENPAASPAANPTSLFCIGEQEFTCLADLALWLRLLTKGDAYYIADRLCGYRVHGEQLQNAAPVRTLCRTERFHIARAARTLGFLEDATEYRHVLDLSKKHIEWAARRYDITAEERDICDAAAARLEAEVLQLQ